MEAILCIDPTPPQPRCQRTAGMTGLPSEHRQSRVLGIHRWFTGGGATIHKEQKSPGTVIVARAHVVTADNLG
jgi:hypothetical protein